MHVHTPCVTRPTRYKKLTLSMRFLLAAFLCVPCCCVAALLQAEQREKERRQKEKQEAHLYCHVRIATDADIAQQVRSVVLCFLSCVTSCHAARIATEAFCSACTTLTCLRCCNLCNPCCWCRLAGASGLTWWTKASQLPALYCLDLPCTALYRPVSLCTAAPGWQ